MTFATREEAGRMLGQHLVTLGVSADLVLGLPRGGVVVAAEVARIMGAPLDVVVVRKIGHPWHREFAVGALAEGGVLVLDQRSIGKLHSLRAELDEVIAEEQERLREYAEKFGRVTPAAREGKSILVVDDGLATGATTEAAVRALRQQGARRIIVAVPVAAAGAVHRLTSVADEVITLLSDWGFDAVGRYYHAFPQTTDEEVVALLRKSRTRSA